MGPIVYNPVYHRVEDIPFTHYLREHYPDLPVMTYFHEGEKNWVAGLWLGNKRFIREVCILGPSPGAILRCHAEIFDRMVRGTDFDPREIARAAKSAERAYWRKVEENDALRKQGLDKLRWLANDHYKDHPSLKIGATYGAYC